MMRVFILKKATILRIVAFLVIIAGAVFYTQAVTKKDATETFSQQQGEMAVCFDTDGKEVAITIDTTFGEDRTEEILSVLERHGAKATFAVMGLFAESNRELIREMIDAGHDVISHSMEHQSYSELTEQQVKEDALAAKEMLQIEFGIDTSLVRPPYGEANEAALKALKEAGLTPVSWSVDARDWSGDSTEKIVSRVLNNVKEGSIILFQNNCKNTPEALDELLTAFADRSYRTVGLSEVSFGEMPLQETALLAEDVPIEEQMLQEKEEEKDE